MKYLQKQIFHRTIALKPIIIILLLALFSGAAYGSWRIFRGKVCYSPPSSEIILDAEIILVGKVISKKTEQVPGNYPLTYVTILPEYYIKGNAFMPEIVVKIRGGKTEGDFFVIVPGWVDFKEDKEVLLFLNRWMNEQYYHLVGDSAGKYPIQTDETTGRRKVVNPDFPFHEAMLFRGKQASLDEVIAQLKRVMEKTNRWWYAPCRVEHRLRKAFEVSI